MKIATMIVALMLAGTATILAPGCSDLKTPASEKSAVGDLAVSLEFEDVNLKELVDFVSESITPIEIDASVDRPGNIVVNRVSHKNVALSDVLDEILTPHGLNWHYDNDKEMVIISDPKV